MTVSGSTGAWISAMKISRWPWLQRKEARLMASAITQGGQQFHDSCLFSHHGEPRLTLVVEEGDEGTETVTHWLTSEVFLYHVLVDVETVPHHVVCPSFKSFHFTV